MNQDAKEPSGSTLPSSFFGNTIWPSALATGNDKKGVCFSEEEEEEEEEEEKNSRARLKYIAKKSTKKDPNKPKRGKTAYILFTEEARRKVQDVS